MQQIWVFIYNGIKAFYFFFFKSGEKSQNVHACLGRTKSWLCTLYILDSFIRESTALRPNYQASCFESEKQVFLLKKRKKEGKTDASSICWEAAKHLTTQMNQSDYLQRNLRIYITTHSGSYGDLNSHQKLTKRNKLWKVEREESRFQGSSLKWTHWKALNCN